MPSLPTSLILLGLVAAWLIVLVPMVSKRREHVPESDEDAAGFRILRRRSGESRRRPVLSRTARGIDEDFDGDSDRDVDGYLDGDVDGDVDTDEYDEELVDDEVSETVTVDADADVHADADTLRAAEDAADGRQDADDVEVRVAATGRTDGRGHDEHLDESDSEDSYDEVAERPAAPRELTDDEAPAVAARERESSRAGRVLGRGSRVEQDRGPAPAAEEQERPLRVSARTDRHTSPVRDAAEDWDQVNERRAARAVVAPPRDEDRWSDEREDDVRDRYGVADAGRDGYDHDGYRDEWDRSDDRDGDRSDERDRDRPSAPSYRSRPIRPGRGGYDPQAAARAKAYRYRQRRRVVMVLLALTIVGALLGWLGFAMAWAGAATTTVLLALYLAYLRRQVRFEEEIRVRREARLQRAQEIRPAYRPSVAEQVRAHRGGSYDDDYRVRSHARPTLPPSSVARGIPVDLEDDDPAFDDLEYYEPMPYRRAVGQ